MRVPFVDLRAQGRELTHQLVSAFERVMESGTFILGPEVSDFERRVAECLRVRHAVGVSSGTDAILVSLMALDIGPGDEVVTTPLSFVSTAEAIVRVGATVRFVDVEPETLTLDAAFVEAALTPRTRAVIPVHLYGRPAAVNSLSELSARHGFALVEDAAQAYGSKLAGRWVGTWGKAGCFSFFPTKLLGALGDAGLVVTDDDAVAARVRRLRQHGADGEGRYGTVGGNFRLDAVQAAVLSTKLPHVEQWTSLRRAHARAYDEAFRGLRGFALLEDRPSSGWNGLIYTVRVSNGRRDALLRHLAEQGIETRVYYDPPLHLQPAFRNRMAGPVALPEAERAAREVLSLPLYPELTKEQRDHVVLQVLEFFER